jgi:predicted RNA-binding protein with PUA-like domain
MIQAAPKLRRWLLAVDPRVYHWDTLFVKGKEMWRHAGHKPDALRQLKQIHKSDRALLYHGKPDHALYALAEVSREPYPDPHHPDSRKSRAAKNKISEEYAPHDFAADRRGVHRDFADGGNRRVSGNSAAVNGRGAKTTS